MGGPAPDLRPAPGPRVPRARFTIPLLLATAMIALVGFSAWEGGPSTAQAVPVAQYVSSSPSPASPFANPLVDAGVAFGILVILFALLLAMRLRGGAASPPEREEETPAETSAGEAASAGPEGAAEEGTEPEEAPSEGGPSEEPRSGETEAADPDVKDVKGPAAGTKGS